MTENTCIQVKYTSIIGKIISILYDRKYTTILYDRKYLCSTKNILECQKKSTLNGKKRKYTRIRANIHRECDHVTFVQVAQLHVLIVLYP